MFCFGFIGSGWWDGWCQLNLKDHSVSDPEAVTRPLRRSTHDKSWSDGGAKFNPRKQHTMVIVGTHFTCLLIVV